MEQKPYSISFRNKWLPPALLAEIRKGRHSFAVWLSLAGTLANVVIFLGFSLLDEQRWQALGTMNPWQVYVTGFFDGIAFMMLPLYVIILCTLVTFMEHRQGMWVNLLTLPVSRWQLYWNKQLFILLLFIAAHVLFIIAMLLAGLLLGLVKPSTQLLSYWPDFGQIARLAFLTITSIAGLLALHYWISLRFQAFIIPLTIGIIGFVTVSLLGPDRWYHLFNPYAYPIQYMPDYKGDIQLLRFAGLPASIWMSLLYFGLFTLLGYQDMRRREMVR